MSAVGMSRAGLRTEATSALLVGYMPKSSRAALSAAASRLIGVRCPCVPGVLRPEGLPAGVEKHSGIPTLERSMGGKLKVGIHGDCRGVRCSLLGENCARKGEADCCDSRGVGCPIAVMPCTQKLMCEIVLFEPFAEMISGSTCVCKDNPLSPQSQHYISEASQAEYFLHANSSLPLEM